MSREGSHRAVSPSRPHHGATRARPSKARPTLIACLNGPQEMWPRVRHLTGASVQRRRASLMCRLPLIAALRLRRITAARRLSESAPIRATTGMTAAKPIGHHQCCLEMAAIITRPAPATRTSPDDASCVGRLRPAIVERCQRSRTPLRSKASATLNRTTASQS
jgi:hypothetical protein